MRAIVAFLSLHVLALGALLSRAFAHGTPDEVANKWANNLGNAQQEMQAGIDRVRTAPGQSAVAKRQKWELAMSSQSVRDKWARKTGAVSLQAWQNAMKELGVQRAVSGAQAKKPKFQAAMASLLPYIDQVAATVRAMPDNTPQDREQRALAMMRGMREYTGTRQGG